MTVKPGDNGVGGSNGGHKGNRGPEGIIAEPVEAPRPERIAHLLPNRGLIIKRSLLATAIGGVIPVPVVDEYVSGRVRAGLYLKIAYGRNVDLAPSTAELMGDPPGSSAIRNATITAMTLVALKLAWKKFFALLAAGRGAEEMATTFQFATVFDHYCTKIHVGGPIDRERASLLRSVIHATINDHQQAALVSIFREGSKLLGRSVLEAPAYVQSRLATLAERWVSTRGNVKATLDPTPEVTQAGESQWLDKAAASVETRLGTLGAYLAELLTAFEARWRKAEADAATAKAAQEEKDRVEKERTEKNTAPEGDKGPLPS